MSDPSTYAGLPSSANGDVSLDTFRRLTSSLGISLPEADEEAFLGMLIGAERTINYVDALPVYQDPRLVPDLGAEGKREYHRPSAEENPYNAWSHKTSAKSAKPATDLLAGKTIAIKDNICMAGVPMTAGTQPGYMSRTAAYPISEIDAPVVARVLEAGATIVGVAVCENYSASGTGVTSATGPVQNPWLKGYMTGGSSSGCGSLVGLDTVKKWRERRGISTADLPPGVDMAIGGDQGGSIRLPSAFCGIYGLKPTFGLIPYTGIASLHPMIDHAGPMTTSIRDNALLLSVLAGYDGFDPRMTPETPLRENVPQYHEILDKAIADKTAEGKWTASSAAQGLKVAILKEAWDAPTISDDVINAVKQAGERFRSLGAEVEEISIPMHTAAPVIWAGATRAQMGDFATAGVAPDLLSFPFAAINPSVLTQEWYDTMSKSNPALVNLYFMSVYLSDRTKFPPSMRNKAMTHVHQLRAAYDAVFEKYDVLIMPSVPTVARKHPDFEKLNTVMDRVNLANGLSSLTSMFNITGHPSLSIPVGWGQAEGADAKLPVGMQLVTKRFGESKLYFAASALEVCGSGLDIE